MQVVEDQIQKATQDGTVPGVVLIAETLDGSFSYAKAVGVKDLTTQEPMTLDTVLSIASCTKLLATISTLQVIQSGKLTLDTDVLPYLPELAEQQVLLGFDAQKKPRLQARKGRITVHHLLTHTFGGSYLFISPRLARFYKDKGPPIGPTVPDRAGIPMINEPDACWSYSHGLDWAGLLVERITGVDLDSHMRQFIFQPLGLKDDEIGFWPDRNPAFAAKKASLSIRNRPDAPVQALGTDILNKGTTAAFGGAGAFASMPAYMKVLRSIANPADERLLSRKWKDEMFKSQLNQRCEDSLNTLLNDPIAAATFVGELPANRVRYGFSYGGLVSLDADPGWRGKGTLLWSGYHNLLWYCDVESGLCLLFGTQVATPGDKRIEQIMSMFEKAIYAQIGPKRAKL